MAKVLKTVAVIAGVVALTLAIPGVGTALGLSAASVSTVAAIAGVVGVTPSDARGVLFKESPP